MGHRAYVAYEQPNGTFNVLFSHWGAHNLELCRRIDENHPLGGPNDLEPDFLMELTQALHEAAEEEDLEIGGKAVEKQDEKCVQPEPIEMSVSIETVVEMCEETDIESLYVVEQDFTTHGYTVEQLSFDDEYIGNFLFNPDFLDGKPKNIGYLKGFIRGVKTQLNTLVSDGVLTVEEARDEFLNTVLDKFDRGLRKHVLGHSTCLTADAIDKHRSAFIECGRRTRLFGVMVPSRYDDIRPWQIPTEMDLPPAYDEFSELLANLSTEQPDQSQQTLGAFETGPDTTEPTLERPPDDDLPEVSIATSRGEEGLVVNGVTYDVHELPTNIREAFTDYLNAVRGPALGYTKLHECDQCRDRDDGHEHGYLTTSSNVDEYKNTYSCPRSWQEESIMPHALIGRHGPEAWDVVVTVNGDGKRAIEDSSSREYEVQVRRMEEYEYDGEVREETELTFTAPADDDIPSSGTEDDFPSETVTGETDGSPWELTITFKPNTVDVDWERVDENGGPVEYAYRESGNGTDKEYETLGFLPVEADTDADEITVEQMSVNIYSRVYNRECESTDFTRVWPPSEYLEKVVNPHGVADEEVPNTSQHLSKIRSEVTDLLDSEELLERTALTAYHIWDTYSKPETEGIPAKEQGNTEGNATPEPGADAPPVGD